MRFYPEIGYMILLASPLTKKSLAVVQVINRILFCLGFTFTGGCIYHYDPVLEGSRDALVINGKVTDREGYQYIEISRTAAPYDKESERPVSGYAVEIQDDKGNGFPGGEMEPGLYGCWMDQEYLVHGTNYRLVVTNELGGVFVSDFDELLPCPDIDSITYEIQTELTEDPAVSYPGLQFFVNTDCSGEYAKHLRWELEETWEYHSYYEITCYYAYDEWGWLTVLTVLDHPIFDYFFCWESESISIVYTYSTKHLTSGKITNYPLHFVSNQSDRLSVKYSLLVKQFSLSQEAFQFWHILDEQSKQRGELYEKQPAQLGGNIHPQDAGGEPVLGLFYATSIKEKRLFVSPSLETMGPDCRPYEATWDLIERLLEEYSKVYMVQISPLTILYADQECFDCRRRGGTTERPDFWE
jgi:hypothetical protein